MRCVRPMSMAVSSPMSGAGRVATPGQSWKGELEYDEKVAERIFSCTLVRLLQRALF